jgi:hypothetical protein
MGEVIDFKRRRINREGLLDAIETFVDAIDMPEELYDQFCLGLLRLLYELEPPRRKRKKKRK